MKMTSKLNLFFTLALSLSFIGSVAIAKEHDHRGIFIQLGASGMMDVDMHDTERNLDLGPGGFFGIGHNYGLLGIRTSFHYNQMDFKGGLGISTFETNLFGGTLDLKIYPMHEADSIVQPYVVVGLGANYLETISKNTQAQAGDWGLAGNTGVGLDFLVHENVLINLETSLRPTMFYTSNGVGGNPNDNTYEQFFYGFMGGISFLFGGPGDDDQPVAAAPASTPAPVAKKTYKQGQLIDLEGQINFRTNSAEILPSAYPTLDAAVRKMKSHPEIKTVEVQGHTDARGSDSYNLDLSQRRAESVRKYFISKGISANRLTAKGYGETKPIATNETKEGLLKNRRIEFRATNIEQ